MTMPYGVIAYTHDTEEIYHVERVPYETQSEMEAALGSSLADGFLPENTKCWVQDEDAANRLFAIADGLKVQRPRVFRLTPSNLDCVLNDYTAVVPSQR